MIALCAIAIRFIDATKNITKAICGLVKHDPIRGLDGPKESVLPTGLVWDPRSKSVVLNAQAGFLQWFDPELDTMNFNVTKPPFSYSIISAKTLSYRWTLLTETS